MEWWYSFIPSGDHVIDWWQTADVDKWALYNAHFIVGESRFRILDRTRSEARKQDQKICVKKRLSSWLSDGTGGQIQGVGEFKVWQRTCDCTIIVLRMSMSGANRRKLLISSQVSQLLVNRFLDKKKIFKKVSGMARLETVQLLYLSSIILWS